MARDKTLELTIKIAGKMDRSLSNAISKTQSSVSGLARGLSKVGTVGLAAMGALGVGTVKVLNDATKKAQEFEQQMSDVVKYVDGLADKSGKISNAIDATTGRTFAENYEIMSQGIMKLSAQIPYTREELTKLAAAAGQSGKTMGELIDANGNGFLKDVAMWGTAMDIDAEQAGNWAAKWEKAFNMTHDEVMELADVINYLGANTPTTAAEIAEAVNAAASLGQVAGVDVKTTTALSDALLATAVPAGRVGTTIKRMYTNLSKGSSASEAQVAMWKELGFTAEGIAKSMQSNGTQTLLDVFNAIRNLPSERRVAALSTLFGNWAIEGGAKIVNNPDAFINALEMVNSPDQYKGSMMREFEIKTDTTASVEMMSKSARENLQIEIGKAFLPVKKQFLNTIIDITGGLSENAPALKEVSESLAEFFGNALQKLGTTLTNSLPTIQKALDYLNSHGDTVLKFIGGLAAAFTGMKFAPLIETMASGAGGLISGSGSDKAGLFTRLFSGGKAAAGNLSNVITTGSSLGKAQSSRAMGILGVLQNYGAIFSGKGKIAAGGMAAAGQSMANGGSLFGMLKNMITGSKAGKAVSGGISALGGIGAAFSSGGPLAGLGAIGGSLAPLAAGFGGVVAGALPVVGVISTVIASFSLLHDNADKLRGVLVNLFGDQAGTAFDAFKEKLDGILGFIDNITHGGLAEALGGVKESFVGLFGGEAATLAGNTFDSVVTVLQSVLNVVGQVVDFANTHVKPILENIFNFIVNTALPAILGAFNAVAPAISQLIEGIGTVVTSVASVITSAISAILPVLESWFSILSQVATYVGSAFVSAISAAFSTVSTVVQNVCGVFQGVLDFFGNIFTGNWEALWQNIVDIFSNLVSGIVEIFKLPINGVIGLINGAIRGINSIGVTIPDWVPGIGGTRLGFSIPEIPMLAKGGFTDGPSLAGEAGREAVISFDKSVRSQNLDTWAKAGEMLGARELRPFDAGSGGGGNITFAPQITINGNPDAGVIDDMINQMQTMFESWYEQKQRLQGRTAY